MNVFASTLVYTGLLVALGSAGALAAGVFLRRWAAGHRRRFVLSLIAGLLLAALAFALPQAEDRVPAIQTRLDEFVPVYQFSESHRVVVSASCDRAYAAMLAVTPREIALFQVLTYLRRFGRSGHRSIINAPDDKPLLETAIQTGFRKLAEDPGREFVFGVIMSRPSLVRSSSPEASKASQRPRSGTIAMNFRLEPAGTGCTVATETRVYASDATDRRVFAVYWRLIYPGSALIRRMWLRAIRLRAEQGAATESANMQPGRFCAPSLSSQLAAQFSYRTTIPRSSSSSPVCVSRLSRLRRSPTSFCTTADSACESCVCACSTNCIGSTPS
jgi:hypothetical protein